MVWQFAYIHGVEGISLLSGKNIKCCSTVSLSKTTSTNPNHQNYLKKPLLHGLNLRKSPIKNHAILFWVGSSSGSNTTRLHKAQQISHLETSSITNINHNPPKTIPHHCNSSSCPQARRPIEGAHNFNFSVVTP